MRCSFLTFVLAAVSTVATPALARPFEAELVARSPEPAKKLTFVPPPPSKGGKGGDAQSGNSGIVDGGSVYQLTNSSGKVSNSFGSGEYLRLAEESSAMLKLFYSSSGVWW